MLTEGFFAMTQQFPRHIFSRVIPRHFAKFDHSGTTILVSTNWFCDSSIDTIKQVALRRSKRMLLCDSTIRVHSLRDTAKTWLKVPIDGMGEYRITINYEVDSLDKNKRLQRCTWVEQEGGEKSQMQYYSLRRFERDTYTRRMTITDTAAQTLHVRLLHFPEKPERTSVTFHKVTVEYTPTEEEATHQLYREELGLRIFADHFLRAAREKDSL